jgi:hypothetical protein
VVKHVDAVEVRVVAAAVLAATTDAVLVAHHLPKPGAHLVSTARPVKEIAWEQEARKRKKAGGGGETQSQLVINNSAAVQQELELELIQTQMAQKPMLRAEMYARALQDTYICTKLSYSSRRCTIGEFEPKSVDTRRRRRRFKHL